MAQPLCPPPAAAAAGSSWVLPAGWCPSPPPPSAPGPAPGGWAGVPAASPRAPTAPGRARPAPRGGQRRSASEREKLRMRTLARALLRLRRYLPASVAPAGQSLTKIETLRLAIRYIAHLSAVLGLSDARLQQQRQRLRPRGSSPGDCPLCPDAQVRPEVPVGAAWGSPPAGALAPASPDPPALYVEAAWPEGSMTEAGPSSPLFPGDVLALLESWTALEWTPA